MPRQSYRSSFLVSKKFASYEGGQWAHGWLALAERVFFAFNFLSSNKSISKSWKINNDNNELYVSSRSAN